MPGKVNPVIPEVVNQIAFQVVGNDVTVSFAAEAGQLQLNAFEPIILASPMAWTEVGGFFRSSDDLPAPDIQVHAAPGIVRDQVLAAPLEPGMSFGPYVARPASRGAVTLRHSHPYGKPRIFHHYLDDPDDQARLREGVRLCLRIARERRLTDVLDGDLSTAAAAGLAPVSDLDRDIDEFIRTQSFSFYHPSGTYMMGKVVENELRVYGLDNVMIGEKAAALIRES